MAQDAAAVPPKGLFDVGLRDFLLGLLMALFPHFIAIGKFLIGEDHWPSWPEWQPYAEMSFLTFMTYIGKNFLTNNEGQMFKADAPTVTVGSEQLKEELKK